MKWDSSCLVKAWFSLEELKQAQVEENTVRQQPGMGEKV